MTVQENPMMDTIHHLSETIGVRPPLSQQEYEVSQYIKGYLLGLGIDAIEEQSFYSSRRLVDRLLPISIIASMGMAFGISQRRWKQYLGGLLALFAGFESKRAKQGQATIAETTILPQRRAQNTIAYIPPRAQCHKRVILIAHVDTDRQRLSAHPKFRELIPDPANTLSKLALWGTGLFDKKTPRWLRKLMFAGTLAQSALIIADEMSVPLHGAYDNASGIALLLCIAETLMHHPLEHTEVVLAFTACDTLHGRGTAELVAQYGDEWQAAQWIVVDHIGSGELCWVTDDRQPHTESITDIMRQIAHSRPEWGIMGRPISVPCLTEPLLSHHLNAVAVMGYERMSSYPERWRQAEDNFNGIDLAAFEKTRQFLSATLTAIDKKARLGMKEAVAL